MSLPERPRAVSPILLGLALVLASGPARSATGEPEERTVRFDATTPLASNAVLAERLATPLRAAAIPKRLAAMGKSLRDQPIDLAGETFRIFVPPAPAGGGYGLLVFVPPWDDNRLPEGWPAVLRRRGVIFVSPTNAGNDVTALGRRAPLAILAAVNLMNRYPIDPGRVWIAGFSGGSKVALHLAVAYPDLFRGAFLDAGAEPLGDLNFPPPRSDLFRVFRDRSRLAFFAGDGDGATMEIADSLGSLHRWCFTAASADTGPHLGHEIAPGSALAWALAILDAPARPNSASDRCWGGVEARMAADLAAARDALARRDIAGAQALLDKLDHRFGGLAAPASLQLADDIAKARVGGPAAR